MEPRDAGAETAREPDLSVLRNPGEDDDESETDDCPAEPDDEAA